MLPPRCDAVLFRRAQEQPGQALVQHVEKGADRAIAQTCRPDDGLGIEVGQHAERAGQPEEADQQPGAAVVSRFGRQQRRRQEGQDLHAVDDERLVLGVGVGADPDAPELEDPHRLQWIEAVGLCTQSIAQRQTPGHGADGCPRCTKLENVIQRVGIVQAVHSRSLPPARGGNRQNGSVLPRSRTVRRVKLLIVT